MPCISLMSAPSGTLGLSRFQRLSRNEAGDRRQAAHVKDHPTPLRLKCDAPPIRSADNAWVLDRPSQARRCEDAVVAIALDEFLALAPVQGLSPKRHRY